MTDEPIGRVVALPAVEVAFILRAGLHRALPVTREDPNIGMADWGNVQFRFGDWTIGVFSDAGEFDYVDFAEAPDGRVGTFDDWDPSPECLLSLDEQSALAAMLGAL